MTRLPEVLGQSILERLGVLIQSFEEFLELSGAIFVTFGFICQESGPCRSDIFVDLGGLSGLVVGWVSTINSNFMR